MVPGFLLLSTALFAPEVPPQPGAGWSSSGEARCPVWVPLSQPSSLLDLASGLSYAPCPASGAIVASQGYPAQLSGHSGQDTTQSQRSPNSTHPNPNLSSKPNPNVNATQPQRNSTSTPQHPNPSSSSHFRHYISQEAARPEADVTSLSAARGARGSAELGRAMAAEGRGRRELLALIHQHLLRTGYARAARELQAQLGQVKGPGRLPSGCARRGPEGRRGAVPGSRAGSVRGVRVARGGIVGCWEQNRGLTRVLCPSEVAPVPGDVAGGDLHALGEVSGERGGRAGGHVCP